MSTSYTVVIPARYASSRLPGKPLQDIAGKPMIQHVWEQASRSAAQRVVVATDDERILSACAAFGAEAVLTRVEHNSGTDRLAEVAGLLGLDAEAIVVNVQGDEPLIPPTVIDQVAANLAAHPEAAIATLAEPITDAANAVQSKRGEGAGGCQRPRPDLQPRAAAVGARCLCAEPRGIAARRAVPPAHRHLCLSCRVPGQLRGLGAVLAGKHRMP